VDAILLGRLGLTSSEVIRAYRKLKPALSVGPDKDDKERKRNSEEFEAVFCEVLSDAGFDADTPMITTDATVADLIFEQVSESPDTLTSGLCLMTMDYWDGLPKRYLLVLSRYKVSRNQSFYMPVDFLHLYLYIEHLPGRLSLEDDNMDSPTQARPYHDEIPASTVPDPSNSDELSDVDALAPLAEHELPAQSTPSGDSNPNQHSPPKPRAVSIVDAETSGPTDDHSRHPNLQSTPLNRPTISSSSRSFGFPPLVVTAAPLLTLSQMRRPLQTYVPPKFNVAIPRGLSVGKASDYIDCLPQAQAEPCLRMRKEVATTSVGPDMTSLSVCRAELIEVRAEGVLDDGASVSTSPES
jgi:hypothetical protein